MRDVSERRFESVPHGIQIGKLISQYFSRIYFPKFGTSSCPERKLFKARSLYITHAITTARHLIPVLHKMISLCLFQVLLSVPFTRMHHNLEEYYTSKMYSY